MEENIFKRSSYLAETAIADQQEKRFAVIEAEFFTAGVLLESEGVSWWTPHEAGFKVREIRANFEKGIEVEDSDIRSGVGYTAVSHLVEKGKVRSKPSEVNPNIALYQTVPQETADITI